MTIEKEPFGKLDEQDITRFILKNNNGVVIKIINYGGIITNIFVPDKAGKLEDVCLGFDDLEGYKTNPPYFGAIIGRYANRIAYGKFEIDVDGSERQYQLPINNGNNSLHGGLRGFDKRVWTASVVGDTLELEYTSADMEEGYPGEVTAVVKYRLTDENELVIDYSAKTTKSTVINLTNHAYFNLAGHDAGKIYNHVAKINAPSYTPVNDETIPTGEIASVNGTFMDLRKPRQLGDMIPNVPGGVGYDHNYCFDITGTTLKPMARIEDPTSKRYLEVSSNQPGMQFYTAYYLDVEGGKGGATYGQYGAFCLETQHYPDSPNQKNFPTTLLEPGEEFLSRTKFKFGVAS